MEAYAQALNIAIPVFILLILAEEVAARIKGVTVNRGADVIASLSSGITNVVKDVLGLTVVLISYDWLTTHCALLRLENTWTVYLAAFIAKDFAGYWIHRLEHEVNFLWNRHIIHHSSEEFNLSCALRQSISQVFSFFAIFLLPAALLGVPTEVMGIVAPLHLFGQFWYHTRLIGRMGFLESFLVTPSHHRVHHAINPVYLDRNYGQIFILWDKLFGTFQPELAAEPPVYGVKRPVRTWNPLLINFQHLALLLLDAYRTGRHIDRFRLWFMPTGWRPADVRGRFPVTAVEDLADFRKYETSPGTWVLGWCWLQLALTLAAVFHLFSRVGSLDWAHCLGYAVFIFTSIFSYTTLLDGSRRAVATEAVRALLGIGLLAWQGGDWFGLTAGFPAGAGVLLGLFLLAPLVVAWLLPNFGRAAVGKLTVLLAGLLLADPASPLTAQVVIPLSSGADDVEERADGSLYTNSSDLELVEDGGPQVVGLRFTNVQVPQGSTILGAWLQFTTDEISSGTCQLHISVEPADHAAAFNPVPGNVSGRPRAAEQVDWNPLSWYQVGLAGPLQRTPDLSVLLQLLVDRPGWLPGNAVAFLVEGSGVRTAAAFESNPSRAVTLEIDFLPPPAAALSDLFLNELMAANGLHRDEAGDADDWVELYNRGDAAVNLKGLYLSDDATDLRKWQITTDHWIPPGGFAVVWLDGEPAEGPLHAPFQLDRNGEFLSVVQDHDDQLLFLDALEFPALPLNISYGRKTDGQPEWVYFHAISPGGSNQGMERYREVPVDFSLESGLYPTPLQLTLSTAEPDALIRYTLDGDFPDAGSPVYTSPLTLTQPTVVQARAFLPDTSAGPVRSAHYLIGIQPQLPVLSIRTESDHLWDPFDGIYVQGVNGISGNCVDAPRNWNQDWERPADISFFEADGTPGFAVAAGIKIGGGCSRSLKMKSFNIILREGTYGDDLIDYPLFPGLPVRRFRRLKLRNAGNDFEQMNCRDGLNQTLLFRTVDLDLMAYRPVLTYLNGQFWGVYELRELYNEDYIASHHQLEGHSFDILTNPYSPWGEVNEGDNLAFQELVSIFRHQDFQKPATLDQVGARMDLEQFMNYHIVQIYLGNYDWPANNVRVWRDRDGGKFRWMLFDLDATTNFGAWSKSLATDNTLRHALEPNGPVWPNGPESTLMLRKLMENPSFRQEFIQRSATFRNLLFAPERVFPIADSIQGLLAPAMPQHISRWLPNVPEWGWGVPSGGSIGTWNAYFNQYKAFFQSRRSTILPHYQVTLQLEGTYRLRFGYPPGTPGKVSLHTIGMDIPHDYEGTYFRNIPIRIRAVADPGFTFVKWLETGDTSATIDFQARQDAVLTPVFVPTQPVLTEIHYHPSSAEADEFVELYNPTAQPLSLAGYSFTQGITFDFPPGLILPPDSYLLVARDQDRFAGLGCQVLTWDAGAQLPDEGGLIRLADGAGVVRQDVRYAPTVPWPAEAAGRGASLSLRSPYLDNQLPENWEASPFPGGSPCGKPSPHHPSSGETDLLILEVYPNPVGEVLRVTYELLGNTGRTIELLDNHGRIVGRFELPPSAFPQEKQLSLESVPAGCYFLLEQGRPDILAKIFKS